MSLADTKPLTRRKWLKATLAFGAVAAASSAIAWVRTGGYEVDPARAARLTALTPWQLVVVEHLASRMVAPDRLDDSTIPTADDVGVASFIDGYLAGMSTSMRRDLSRMLQYIEHLAPIAAGFTHRFTSLLPEEQDEVLRSIESSRIALLRAGFEGLKSLVMMGYYRDPRTWRILDYRGPFLSPSPLVSP